MNVCTTTVSEECQCWSSNPKSKPNSLSGHDGDSGDKCLGLEKNGRTNGRTHVFGITQEQYQLTLIKGQVTSSRCCHEIRRILT